MMIRIFLTGLLLFSCFFAKAQYENLDRKSGFRDLKFGMSPDIIPGLVEVSSLDPLVKIYVRPADELKIGLYPVREIQYCFYKNKLYMVTVDVPSSAYNRLGIKEVLISEYGMGNGDNESLKWRGKKVYMTYSYRPEITDMAFLTIMDLELHSQHYAEQLSRVKRVPSGL